MKLYHVPVGPLQVNCFILADSDTKEAVVIDAGDDAARILHAIKENNLSVKYIVNTHAHFDHIGANKALKDATGAPLMLHEADAPLLSVSSAQARSFGMPPVSSPPADRMLNHGETISVGGITLTVLHTPGHTLGGICLLGDGFVFTGDTLFAGSIGRTDFPGGDLGTILHSIKTHLMILPDDTQVFPGHGPASTIGDERRENPFLNDSSGF